jgi:murein DD-endopeptidase MepM/ murein hydrolase activator NlpD
LKSAFVGNCLENVEGRDSGAWMSQRSRVQSHRVDSDRDVASNASYRRTRWTGYTIIHAGHQFRLGPVTFWIVVGSLVIMAGWSLATGTYFAFHDDVLTRLIARQKEQQFAYEDRIAELRAQVDRFAGRQLLDQEQFEQKLEQILRRQATLESRASSLAGLPDPAPTGSIKGRPPQTVEPPQSDSSKPSPISDTVIFVPPPDREARLQSRIVANAANRTSAEANSTANGVEGVVARVQNSLDRIEARQIATLNTLEERYDSRAKRIRSVLVDLGIDGKKVGVAPSAVGGPFVPLMLRRDSNSFERQLYRINVARANVDRLTRVLGAVPLRKPISGEVDLTSGFGVRPDPFLGRPAMHTGLDFRSNIGDPVRATANGTVESAGWNGGYGKMVEVDHGNGYSTRYGHLSEIDVKPSQTVKIGQIIGRVGSTGRSTGPHLHYETRLDGEAVDPQKLLHAGIRLGNAM